MLILNDEEQNAYDILFQSTRATSRLDTTAVIDKQIDIIQRVSKTAPPDDLAMLSDSLCRLAEMRMRVLCGDWSR